MNDNADSSRTDDVAPSDSNPERQSEGRRWTFDVSSLTYFEQGLQLFGFPFGQNLNV